MNGIECGNEVLECNVTDAPFRPARGAQKILLRIISHWRLKFTVLATVRQVGMMWKVVLSLALAFSASQGMHLARL